MKLICTRENLKKGLFAVSRVVGNNNPLQVLNNILIKTDEGRIKFSSTNLEIGINTWVGGKVEQEGSLTVPARLINEYINNLPTEKVVLTASENNTLSIESENYHTTIKGLSSEDFPLIPRLDDSVFAKIDGADLRAAFAETLWATAANETQPEISGVFLGFQNNQLRVAATDRYRLAERTATLKESINGHNKEVIVPARTISELYKILSMGAGEVEIYFSESQVLFKFDGTELVSRLIDGVYPDYQQIIPAEFKTEVEIKRDDLIHALKAASLFVPDSNNITVDVVEDGITVKASSVASGDNTTQIKAKVSGPANSAVFNYRYLVDCLNNINEAMVRFKMINDTSPSAIVPEGRTNYIYIVMPIKL